MCHLLQVAAACYAPLVSNIICNAGLLVALLHSSDSLCCAQAAMAIANCALEPANANFIISQQVKFAVPAVALPLRSLIRRALFPGLCLLSVLSTPRSMQPEPSLTSAITACRTKNSSADSPGSCSASRPCSGMETSTRCAFVF